MISEVADKYQKIQEYFEALESAAEEGNIDKVDLFLAKLSPYYHMFDDDQEDLYQVLSAAADDEPYEPTEADEWYDYDPDC